jgi:hypothetical protein
MVSLYLAGNSRPTNARVSKPRAQRSSLRSNTARRELEGDGGCRTRATRRVASLSLSLSLSHGLTTWIGHQPSFFLDLSFQMYTSLGRVLEGVERNGRM